MPGQYNSPPEEVGADDICSGRILQRLTRRYKALKRVECVYYSAYLRIRPADPLRPTRLSRLFHGDFVLDSAVATKTTQHLGP
jgi:hypothetical protein